MNKRPLFLAAAWRRALEQCHRSRSSQNSGLFGTWWGGEGTREHPQKETEGRSFVYVFGTPPDSESAHRADSNEPTAEPTAREGTKKIGRPKTDIYLEATWPFRCSQNDGFKFVIV